MFVMVAAAAVWALTGKEGAGVMQVVILRPLPLTLAHLADDEEDDGESSTDHRRQHQELEAVDQTLRVKDQTHG